MKSKIILTLIILLGFVLRFFQLGVNPPSLDWDEASLGYNAYSILKTARDEYGSVLPLSIRSFNDYKPPLYTYLTVIPVSFLGLTEFSVRSVSAVFGSLAVFAVYLLIRQLRYSDKTALLTSLFLSLSPWHLQFSRVAFEANIALTLIIIAVYFFYKGLKNGIYLAFSSIFFGLSLYAYHSPRLIVPVLIFGFIIINFLKIKTQKLFLLVFLILLFLFYLPIFNDLSNGSSARFSSVSVINPDQKLGQSIKYTEFDFKNADLLGKLTHNRRVIYFREILAGYLDHFDFDFLFLTGDAPGRHHAAGIGMLYFTDLLPVAVGFLALVKRINSRFVMAIFYWYLVAPIASAITSGTPHAVRAIFYLPIYQIFSSVGLLSVINFLKNKFSDIKTVYIMVTFIGLLLFINWNYYFHQYYIHTPLEHAPDWQFGYKEAVAQVNKYQGQVSKIIFTYKYDQPYIFFLFYNKIDPLWYQNNWGRGEIGRSERKFAKFEFRNLDWEKDKDLSSVLLVGTPAEIPESASGIVSEITFPDGQTAFRIVKRD